MGDEGDGIKVTESHADQNWGGVARLTAASRSSNSGCGIGRLRWSPLEV